MVKRPGVLSKVQMLNLVLGVGVFFPSSNCAKNSDMAMRSLPLRPLREAMRRLPLREAMRSLPFREAVRSLPLARYRAPVPPIARYRFRGQLDVRYPPLIILCFACKQRSMQ